MKTKQELIDSIYKDLKTHFIYSKPNEYSFSKVREKDCNDKICFFVKTPNNEYGYAGKADVQMNNERQPNGGFITKYTFDINDLKILNINTPLDELVRFNNFYFHYMTGEVSSFRYSN